MIDSISFSLISGLLYLKPLSIETEIDFEVEVDGEDEGEGNTVALVVIGVELFVCSNIIKSKRLSNIHFLTFLYSINDEVQEILLKEHASSNSWCVPCFKGAITTLKTKMSIDKTQVSFINSKSFIIVV